VGLGYQFAFAPDLSVNAGFRGESVDVFDPRVPGVPDVDNMLGVNSAYGFSGGIIHDTRDSPFLPTQGHLATFEFEQVIGTFVYPRGVFEGRQYWLLNQRPDGSGRHVLSFGSVLGFSGPDTPAYDNFYAGGYNTLRGFVFRGASPRQAGTNGQLAIVGGPFEWLNTIGYGRVECLDQQHAGLAGLRPADHHAGPRPGSDRARLCRPGLLCRV
jgi:outer membrane protein insertion porin family